ncbi:hypothetical protein KUTeg_011747 [Tegillarca granosa]|uniref:Uncharacterized protein n=1 Tax=Tegillarca granosa TaxID=220873 RepID=A0ABQ9F1X3_TEGGR|nr:hypothetical protein KUTeg_011747 [Tegillarca granosa]
MQGIDTEGVEIRTPKRIVLRAYFAKGPNYIWHIDSKGSPCIVRGDCGTENGHVRDIQILSSKQLIYIETA